MTKRERVELSKAAVFLDDIAKRQELPMHLRNIALTNANSIRTYTQRGKDGRQSGN